MWEGYESLIREGRKRQTIRADDPFLPGPAVTVFEKENGETTTLDANVQQVRTVAREEPTDKESRLNGFDGLDALHSALNQCYPGLSNSHLVDVVQFSAASV